MRHATISQGKKLIRRLGDERVLDSPIERKPIIHRPSLMSLMESDSLSESYEELDSVDSPPKSRSSFSINKKPYEIDLEENRERSNSVNSVGSIGSTSSEKGPNQKIDKAERSFRTVRNFRKRSGSFTEVLSQIEEEERINYDADADEEPKKEEEQKVRKKIYDSKKKRKPESGEKRRKRSKVKKARESDVGAVDEQSTSTDSSGDDIRSPIPDRYIPSLSDVNLGKSEPLLNIRASSGSRSANSSPGRIRISAPNTPSQIVNHNTSVGMEYAKEQPIEGLIFYRPMRTRGNSFVNPLKNRIGDFETKSYLTQMENRFRSGSLTYEDVKIPDISQLSINPRQSQAAEQKSWVPLMKPCPGFWVEVGDHRLTEDHVLGYHPMIENEGDDILWYQDHYSEKEHLNYLSNDRKGEPIIISTVKERRTSQDNDLEKLIRVLIRSKRCDERYLLNEKQFLKTKLKKLKGVQIGDIVKYLQVYNNNLVDGKIRYIKDPAIVNDLLSFERHQVVVKYKIGILLCKEGQTTEEEMFSNEYGSEYFDKFLELLGDKVELKGFTGYKGGLDTERDTTGTHSVYTCWRNTYEIMFHVSTMLPFSTDNPQQLERKRHLGNDIVVVIFKEGNTPYIPNTISSEYNHVIVVVQPEFVGEKLMYRVSVGSKDGVPAFGPAFPANPIFDSGEKFRDLLICKLVNAEKAAIRSPKFQNKLQRTRSILLKEIETKYAQ